MKPLDSIQLQRMIDGELEYAEVRRILELLDSEGMTSSSEDWKSIATGFIENQMFASQFDAMEQEHATVARRQTPDQPDSRTMPHFWLLSLAASALVTLSIGLLIGANYRDGNPELATTPLADTGGSLVNNRNANETMSSNPAMYRMQLEDSQGNQFIDTDIPFYQVANWKDVDQHRFKEYPSDVRNRVLNSGYDLQQNTRYLQGRLKDGRRFVIPVRNTKFAPYQ